MGDFSGNFDVGKLITYSDDLVAVFKEKKDINIWMQCLDQSKAFQSSCNADFDNCRSLLEDHERKIDECKQRTEKAKLEVSTDKELQILQKEFEEERERERLLMEELRVISNEINDLERQRIFVEEQRQDKKKLEQEELKAQRKLSMYASVTNIIPDLDDNSKISGHIVDREKKMVEKFEFDLTNMASFDTCQIIWKMINQQ